MPNWMWAVAVLGFLWVLKGALPKKRREPKLRLDVNEQLARMMTRDDVDDDDDDLAVLEDERPAKSSKHDYDDAVVGTSQYQKVLERICGGRKEKSANKEVSASLHFENENSYDNQAVRVEIDGKQVGYLDRYDARRFRREVKKAGLKTPLAVPALIVGGWDKGPDDRGHFGVRLELFE